MLDAPGQCGGERPGAAPDIKPPRARARQLPYEQPVVVGIVVPVQQPHAPILGLPPPPDAETASSLAETTQTLAHRHVSVDSACRPRGWERRTLRSARRRQPHRVA